MDNKFSEVVVFGDNEKGKITLVDELSKRLPMPVRVVQMDDYFGEKDANDILRKYGKETILSVIQNAKIQPINHIKELSDVKSIDIYNLERIYMYRAQSKFIKRLKVIAVKYNIVVLIVAHPRKTQSNIENDDVSGSGDITNRVDVVMAYSRTDGEDCDSKLSILKNRLTGKLTSKGEEIKLFYSNSTKRISSFSCNDKSYSWESEQNPIEPGFFALPF